MRAARGGRAARGRRDASGRGADLWRRRDHDGPLAGVMPRGGEGVHIAAATNPLEGPTRPFDVGKRAGSMPGARIEARLMRWSVASPVALKSPGPEILIR